MFYVFVALWIIGFIGWTASSLMIWRELSKDILSPRTLVAMFIFLTIVQLSNIGVQFTK